MRQRCPSDADKEEGAKFNCTAKLSGGGKGTVVVTQTHDRGDPTYSFKPGSVVLADDAVEPVLEDALAQRGVEGSEVDCPSEIAVKVGETVQCSPDRQRTQRPDHLHLHRRLRLDRQLLGRDDRVIECSSNESEAHLNAALA